MFILGLAMPPTPLDKKTEAIMSTEPDWLSGADIESARQTCVELDDFEFTSFIEQRIKGKPNNLVNFE